VSDLGQYERAILRALAEDGGFTTGHIAGTFVSPFGRSKRKHSSDVRAWLLSMKANGLVALMDNQKPAAWVATHAGTAALKRVARDGD
jgi:hypothetical protein